MMQSLKFSGLALALCLIPATAFASDSTAQNVDSAAQAARSAAGQVVSGTSVRTRVANGRNWGGRRDGRWNAGYRAPGGWNAYRRPFVGYVLPRYWINPSFYIGNYAGYGFAAPRSGYGWSRYYNDAVMTDHNGRVQDVISDYDWDRNGGSYDGDGEDYGDSYGTDEGAYRGDRRATGKDRDNGLGGALIGAAVGAVAGNVIAGKGDRLAGSLIGGGLGALAGTAVDKGDRKGRSVEYGHDYDQAEDNVTHRGSHEQRGPHWRQSGHQNGQHYYSYGYGAPVVTTITFQSAPVTTTTTTTEYVTEYVSARKRVYHAPKKRVWRSKARCVCGS